MAMTGVCAVVGATGQQGGATARALLNQGLTVRALVRDTEKAAAQQLSSLGAELRVADLGDPATLRTAFEGVSRVFAMTSSLSGRGTVQEVADGMAIAEAAKATSIEHLVYSSVGGAERRTGVPHFDSKRRIEQHIEKLGLPATFVRPTFFYENLLAQPPAIEDGSLVVRLPLPDRIPLQMVAVHDIGVIAAAAMADPGRVPGGAVEIAGDELTGSQIADAFGARAGMPARYEALPRDTVDDDDLSSMFGWLSRPPAYQADRALTAELAPNVETLRHWLQRCWEV